nr:2-oxoacid:acceptor oxidoreductase subunit alpha [Calditrichia bacterium]
MSDSTTTYAEKVETTTTKRTTKLKEHIVEIVSDSGEGAQTAGQAFGTISARMGNGVWTVEIIPAEIEPPARTPAGASGNRIRLGEFYVTNMGDDADLVVAFNEQALLGREEAGNLKKGCTILLESVWRNHSNNLVADEYRKVYDRLIEDGYNVYEIPMEEECLKIVENPRRGKNMFVLGMLCSIYSRDMELAQDQVRFIFRKKGDKVIEPNLKLLESGYNWAEENLDFKYEIPATAITEPQIVVNGNVAVGMG